MDQQYVVGVHGIRQGKVSQQRLLKDWNRALARGVDALRSAAGLDAAAIMTPVLDVPQWSRLLSREANRLGPADGLVDDSVPFDVDEEAFVVEAMDELLRPEDLAYARELDLTTLGPPKLWPASVTLRAVAYDRRSPQGAGSKLVMLLREVRYYLREPDLAAQVRKLVSEALTNTTSVVIGHSLGSVIAYDLLQGERSDDAEASRSVHTFVTCGSPLGIPAVRRAMGIPDRELMAMPPEIRWINVFDPDDIVAGAAGLSLTARNMTDIQVDTGNIDPHSALNYLRTVPVARAATNHWA
ncbi:endopeptidase [Streptomyces sp. NPDC008317]|uniref:endopeptidase n=1 Tax=Streptomyces sp. NPDC008317 TaxID=3364827 RepID=UPI0036EA10B4